ncbi:hypothetical protein E4T56_gene12397 [Termitomyces sp. T112]|nr:hypothetical protein E4T56_gene12397 [Termitomyces sp. T112]
MPGECSICLSSFKEPVCIPCGHIYCTQCLADFVNTPDNESTKASCPTCRAQFHLLTPDLVYLPKKYHEYVMPVVRRVYLDLPRYSDLKKELKSSRERIKKLEKDNDILMRQCERHMAAAKAQAEGERAARQRATDLQSQLRNKEEELYAADINAAEALGILKDDVDVSRAEYQTLEKAFNDLGRRYDKLKARQDQVDASTSRSIAQEHHGHHSVSRKSRQSLNFSIPDLYAGPARGVPKPKARPASPPPVYANKRQRLVLCTGYES